LAERPCTVASAGFAWIPAPDHDAIPASRPSFLPASEVMHLISRQKGAITLFTLLLTVFVAAMAYWLWRAYTQVSLEIELACRVPAAEACVSAKARYMDSFYAAWLSQMFPWILPFVPAFIYVFFFHWLRKNRQPPTT
jgi:hypothetical protein